MLAPAAAHAVTVLGPADYRSMPWKNGGGRTTEIAARPHGADLAGFTWRVSIADVERDGPFSPFPGIARTLVLLAGNGMRLTGPDGALELRRPLDVAAFPGEHAIGCALVDGPTRDFNLMVRREAARGTLTSVGGSPQTFLGANALLCFAAAGAVECAVAGSSPIVVAGDHALVLEGPSAHHGMVVRALETEGAALVCRIEHVAARAGS